MGQNIGTDVVIYIFGDYRGGRPPPMLGNYEAKVHVHILTVQCLEIIGAVSFHLCFIVSWSSQSPSMVYLDISLYESSHSYM
jgi:hypothetical protein